VQLAGQLHDLGKLAVPSDLLEKPGRLEPEEFHVVQSHAFHTHRILRRIPALEEIEPWAARHHERMDGTGYPFHHRAPALPEPARVVAVADVFTALTEDRPYRAAMPLDRAQVVVEEMVDDGHLDGDVVQLLVRHRQDVDDARAVAQDEARHEYRLLQSHEISQG
jgi:HD-GYP domain-containing protein (c-di-GMP phosphodiesterase class II)